MSEGSFESLEPAWLELHNLRSACSEKDAEIERLKAEFRKAEEWNKLIELQVTNLQGIVEDQEKLITELADALEILHVGPDGVRENCYTCKLLQRAREAVK